MRDVVFLEGSEVQKRGRRVHATRDGGDVVRHRDTGGEESQGGGVDAGRQEAAVGLEDVNDNGDFGARVEVGLDDGFERLLDCRRKFQHASEYVPISVVHTLAEGVWTYLSPRPRFRLSPVLNGKMLTSTVINARSYIVWPLSFASLGPNTSTMTSVRPCVMMAEPSADPLGERSMVMSRSSYCLRPSERYPPSLRISTREL